MILTLKATYKIISILFSQTHEVTQRRVKVKYTGLFITILFGGDTLSVFLKLFEASSFSKLCTITYGFYN